MASNMEFLRREMDGATLRATAEGMGHAVVLTDTELVLGRAGLIGRWGSKVERYDLGQLTGVHTISYPTAHMLSVEFATPDPKSVSIMYGSTAQPDFERIIAALQERAATNGHAAAR